MLDYLVFLAVNLVVNAIIATVKHKKLNVIAFIKKATIFYVVIDIVVFALWYFGYGPEYAFAIMF